MVGVPGAALYTPAFTGTVGGWADPAAVPACLLTRESCLLPAGLVVAAGAVPGAATGATGALPG